MSFQRTRDGFVEQRCADCGKWLMLACYRPSELKKTEGSRYCDQCLAKRDKANRRSWGMAR